MIDRDDDEGRPGGVTLRRDRAVAIERLTNSSERPALRIATLSVIGIAGGALGTLIVLLIRGTLTEGLILDYTTVTILAITAGIVAWQAFETRRAADGSRDSIRISERHFELQNAQWLDISLVRVQAIKRDGDSAPLWHVRVTIDNRTAHPVRITRIELEVEGERTIVHTSRTITPNRNYRPRIDATAVASVTLTSIAGGRPVWVSVYGCVTYTNALQQEVREAFGRRGVVRGQDETRLKDVIPGAEHPDRFQGGDLSV